MNKRKYLFASLLTLYFLSTTADAKKTEKKWDSSVTNPYGILPSQGKIPLLLLPARAKGALTGSQFIKKISKFSKEKRELAILTQIRHGNIPSFLRKLKPVILKYYYPKQNRIIKTTIFVTPDYLGIGSDGDWVRIPMTPQIAQNIADHAGAMLPTQKIVDAIWKQADVQIKPHPLSERGDSMRSSELFLRHNSLVNDDLAKSINFTNIDNTALIAGHKKDIIITSRISQNPGRVAIYGWHNLNGHIIQPISLVHNDEYSDYSHGVRLVSIITIVEGNFVYLDNLLRKPQLSWVVSDEGELPIPTAYINKNHSPKRLLYRSLAERLKLPLRAFFGYGEER